MRKPIIAGNWKMNKTPCEGAELVRGAQGQGRGRQVRGRRLRAVCGPYGGRGGGPRAATSRSARRTCTGRRAAYTGEISADMLKAVGAEYVVLGHSERRQYFAETDETVNKKVLCAVANGLTPIICVGESLQQRENGETDALVSSQTVKALAGLTGEQVKEIVIAYEPIWAHRHGQDGHRRAGQRDHRRHPQGHRGRVRQGGGRRHPHPVRRAA